MNYFTFRQKTFHSKNMYVFMYLYEFWVGFFSENSTNYALLECLNDGFGNNSFILHS